MFCLTDIIIHSKPNLGDFLSPKTILFPPNKKKMILKVDDTFRTVKPSNTLDKLTLKYVFRQSDFQRNCFWKCSPFLPQSYPKIKLWDKVYQYKVSKGFQWKKGRGGKRKSLGLKEKQASKPLKIVLEHEVNGYYLVKLTNHLYSLIQWLN